MTDEFFTRTQPLAARSGGLRSVLFGVVIAILIGGGVVGYLAWSQLYPFDQKTPDQPMPPLAAQIPLTQAQPAAPADLLIAPQVQAGAMDTRIAALEQRLSQLDLRAAAASDNAARAEGLLIAFAARRALDRGVPLGYLEDHLRLRFADALPNAVRTVIDASRQPVTLDQLDGELNQLANSLSQVKANGGLWDKVKFEVSSLFVVRHDSAPDPSPASQIDRARIYLAAGKIEAAVADVQRLPGAADANRLGNGLAKTWVTSARRYVAARRALDLIETTALLDTRALEDGKGKVVDQPGVN